MADDPMHGKTTAPTNQHTLDLLVQKNAKFTELELDFVTLTEMHFGKTGRVMSYKEADDEYGIDKLEYDDCVTNTMVLKALEERGISFKRVVVDMDNDTNTSDAGVNTNWRTRGLTAEQLVVANTMLDLLDTKSDKKKLQDLGVETKKYQNWLLDPVFSGYLRDRAEAMLGSAQHEASLALLDGIRQGNMKAVSMYMEYTNRFVPKQNQPQVLQTTDNQNFDLDVLLNDIIEIIVDEVNSPAEAANIADRLKGLMTKRAILSHMHSGSNIDPITDLQLNESLPVEPHLPKVAANRVMTPELMAAMEKVGFNT